MKTFDAATLVGLARDLVDAADRSNLGDGLTETPDLIPREDILMAILVQQLAELTHEVYTLRKSIEVTIYEGQWQVGG